jgi:hypothetical protein
MLAGLDAAFSSIPISSGLSCHGHRPAEPGEQPAARGTQCRGQERNAEPTQAAHGCGTALLEPPDPCGAMLAVMLSCSLQADADPRLAVSMTRFSRGAG